MHHELKVVADPDTVAGTAAAFVDRPAPARVQAHGRCTFAVSRRHAPWAMSARLTHEDVPCAHAPALKVDEPVTPDGDPDRTLNHPRQSLGTAPAEVIAAPVNDAGLDTAAAAYRRSLPERCDPVHLDPCPIGHTASPVPQDPVHEVPDRPVALTAPRMGDQRITGADRPPLLSRLVAGDRLIPADRVETAASRVPSDAAAGRDPVRVGAQPSAGP